MLKTGLISESEYKEQKDLQSKEVKTKNLKTCHGCKKEIEVIKK
jgi:hypothetical protein